MAKRKAATERQDGIAAEVVGGGGRTLVTTDNTVEIEGQDKPALIATALTMVLS